jgi:uncharacterized protein YydD (DUF2326 family)
VVRNPPRIAASDADLEAQFRLAMQVRDKTSEANELVKQIRELRKQGRESDELNRVEEELYQVRNRSPRDTLNYPIKLNNQLAFPAGGYRNRRSPSHQSDGSGV